MPGATISIRTDQKSNAAGPCLASLALFLLLLPAAAYSADRQQEESDEKKPPAQPKAAPLRFTDEDLEKYHKPKAPEPDMAVAEEQVESGAPGPTTPAKPQRAPAASKPSSTKPRAAGVGTPPKAAKLPAEDPLKPWRDRDALEGFRREQLEELRQKIAALQSRLDYLNTKRGALLNPNPVQVGGTGSRAFQFDENGNPIYQTDPAGEPVLDPNGNPIPVNKPSIAPGRGQPKMLPIFPALPEPQTDQDREDDKRMKVKDLLEKVEEEIESVEAELEGVKRNMVSIETRFDQEMAPR